MRKHLIKALVKSGDTRYPPTYEPYDLHPVDVGHGDESALYGHCPGCGKSFTAVVPKRVYGGYLSLNCKECDHTWRVKNPRQ